jgi:protein gp37
MARNSTIEWTHHTFNPWWGCVKVSPACAHCYAENWSRRVGLSLWEREGSRRFFGVRHWQEPISWNAEAERTGVRRRVFCASMADVFESREDLNPWRIRLWELIGLTPWLDWLLLTKRPDSVGELVPWTNSWPANVWLGTTAENQLWLERRANQLACYPAAVRFISCEPLLAPLDLTPVLGTFTWLIAGGESGAKARPSHPEWFRSLRDQCVESGIAFHFKQWGEWAPALDSSTTFRTQRLVWKGQSAIVERRGKKFNGRQLDGRTWDQVPLEEGVNCAQTNQSRAVFPGSF